MNTIAVAQSGTHGNEPARRAGQLPGLSGGCVVNKSDALRFFHLVAPGERITFQLFTDAKPKPKPDPRQQILHGHPVEFLDRLINLNESGAGIFWMVNRGNFRGRRMENVKSVRALYADLDGADPKPVFAANPPPSVIVETSPGRFHTYWLVRNCPIADFTPRQLQLVERFHSDPNIANINSVMRVPGFVHQKDPDNRFVSRIILPSGE